MNINDIFCVFEQLGIRCIINNNKVTFYDAESGLQMEIWEDKTKELSLDNLQIGRYYTLVLKSQKKMLRFELDNPHIDGKNDRNQIILTYTCYNNGNNSFEVDFKQYNKSLDLNIKYIEGNRIHFEDDNYISFNIDNKFGVYDNGYDEDYYLSKVEMRDVLVSSKEIQIFSEYYGKMYPELLETIKNAKSHTKSKY